MNPRISLVVGLCLLGLLSCRKNREIEVYTVENEVGTATGVEVNPHGSTLPPVSMPGEVADPHAGMGVLSAPEFKDEPAAHWVAKKRSAMRLASYQIAGEHGAEADISFTSLRSAPGSLWANLNRWRSQLGLSDLEEQALRESTQTVASAFGDALLMDIEGLLDGGDPLKDGRIIGAIAEKDGRAWFYKMRGNASLLGAEKQNFIRWIASLRPQEAPTPLPASVTDGEVTWKLPEGWESQPGSGNRYATIAVPVEGVELVVSWFPGDVGGDVANVNRWRAQVGLQPLDEAEVLSLIQKLGEKGMSWVDVSGPDKRMLCGWCRHGENTWFFKLTGTGEQVDDLKSSFVEFLNSVQF